MIEYLEHVIKKHPEEAYVLRDGEVAKFKTGDQWFDDLEERVARGDDITLESLGLPTAKRSERAVAASLRPGKPGPAKIEQKLNQEPPAASDDLPEEINESY